MPLAKVASGQLATAAQHNAIVDEIDDATTGHNHDGAYAGRKVSHVNLTDGAITGTTNTHAQIDSHIAGSANKHGLGAVGYVAGGQSAGAFIQAGNDTFGNSDTWKAIAFPIAFTTIVTVCITMQVEDEGPENGCAVRNMTTTGFEAWVHAHGSQAFGWIAVGTLTA